MFLSEGLASLPECFAFVHVWPCVSAGVFCVRSRLLFDARAKQDGLRKDTFLFRRGSRSPLARSRVAVRLSDLDGSFRDCAFSGGDPDGETKGRRERSRRRGRVRFCVIILALRRFPRGVRWGKMRKPHCGRAPNLRQRVECGSRTAASLDSLHVIRGASEKAIQ